MAEAIGRNQADVIIVGGGLVGASLAVALSVHQPSRRVLLIESALPPALEPAWDERTIALNLSSERIFRRLGVWEAIAAHAAPIVSTHIGEQGRFGAARFHAKDAQAEALGHNVPIRVIGESLMAAVKRSDAIEFRCPARLQSFHQIDELVCAELIQGERVESWSAPLMVAADGAQSVVRQALQIEAQSHDYGQSAVISTVRTQRAHCGVAYERFTSEGPVAMLPRKSGHCAAVWTVPTERAKQLLELPDTAFLNQLQQAFGSRLGPLSELGRRSAYPLHQIVSSALRRGRVLLAGNAAQTLHPVAAQGFNLGLRDVASLTEIIADAEDPGADELLASYVTRRQSDRMQVADFTDHLVRLFSNQVPGLSQLRHLGILGLDLMPSLKHQILRQNLGLSAAGFWQHQEPG